MNTCFGCKYRNDLNTSEHCYFFKDEPVTCDIPERGPGNKREVPTLGDILRKAFIDNVEWEKNRA